jgi:hypothetical protein
MKINELIKELQEYPQDWDVCVYDDYSGDKCLVEKVEVKNNRNEEICLTFNIPVP